MGSWSGLLLGSPWDCKPYRDQTPKFVKGVQRKTVQFGYRGQHTARFSDGITVEDVRWLMQYLGRITDAQIRSGLLASGATPQEEDCFANALRTRIEQLRAITSTTAAPALR
jgi:hypothetical protein